MDTKRVHAQYDADAQVWWAESDDIPGLVSEAPTLDALVDRLVAVVPELLAANNAAAGEVNLEIVATRHVQPA